MTFAEAKALYSTISLMRESVEDGMWESVKEAADDYRASFKEDDDKQAFVDDLIEILDSYGYPHD